MLTVGVYSLFTFLSGIASSYEMLLVFRVFQGIGFGGEWAVGAILVAELIKPEARGKALGVIQSAWAVGWALAVVAYTIVFSLVSDEQGWRILMMLGILPALLILYVRQERRRPGGLLRDEEEGEGGRPRGRRGESDRDAAEADLPLRPREDDDLRLGPRHRHPGRLLRDVHLDPDFLKEERDLTVVGSAGYLFVVIAGAFLGYLSAGFVHDRLGRRKTFTLFASLAGISLVAYFLVPEGSNTTLLIIGFPLGFFASGCFSGFGSYLAELFPTRARGTGAGFCYNVGRAFGALFPGIIGFLAAAIGLGGAVAFGVFGYVLAIAALRFLPETHGKELVPVE